MFSHDLGDALLRADTVSSGDEHRLTQPFQRWSKQSSKATDFRNDPGNERTFNMLLHQAHTFIAGFDINTGRSI